jgi:hypothetical protein
MEKRDPVNAIPKDVAFQLCKEIRKENRGKWYTPNGLWCWGCATFTKSDPAKMCWHSPPDYRGCGQVNERYDRQ